LVDVSTLSWTWKKYRGTSVNARGCKELQLGPEPRRVFVVSTGGIREQSFLPRYFFHMAAGPAYVHDFEGADYADHTAARRRAIEDILAVWQSRTIRRLDPGVCAVVVSDQGGRELFRVPFAEAPGVLPPA
jgi:hypothetical protein